MNKTIKAQEWLNDNYSDKNIKSINLTISDFKLSEDLKIEGYSQLEEIILPNQELTALSIINCPQLKKINVRNNHLTSLNISQVNNQSEIKEIIIGENNLTTLDLIDCQQLKELIIPDNPALIRLENLNLQSIQIINLVNTQVSLTSETEKLKQKITDLSEVVRILDQGGQERKLIFTEAIQTPRQLELAIKQQLKETIQEWRDFFRCSKEEAEDKHPRLFLFFQRHPEKRCEAQGILITMIEALENGTYEELIEKWNKGKKYNAEYDFDGNLNTLMRYVGLQKKIDPYQVNNYE